MELNQNPVLNDMDLSVELDKLTIKDILIKARKKISNPLHWRKNAYRQVNQQLEIEQVCAIGAIQSVLHPDFTAPMTAEERQKTAELEQEARKMLAAAMPQWYHSRGRSTDIEAFNDSSRRTHDDVVRLFDKAIDYADRLEQADA